MLLACHPAIGVTSVSELIDLAKSCDPALTYATSAIGGAPHLAAELFQAMTGTAMRHVRYDETQRLYRDLEAGVVSLSFNNLISMLPRCGRGALRALAVSSAERSAVAPEIPTIAESGVPGYEVTNWVGIVAPRATPQDCLDELSHAITTAVKSDAVRTALRAAGATPCGGTPQLFASFMASEVECWRAIASRLQCAGEHQ
jgi:tripartite-type tricarboxylate transporter receptor subunit TctC